MCHIYGISHRGIALVHMLFISHWGLMGQPLMIFKLSVWQRAAGNGSAWCCLFFLLSVELLGLILPFYTHTLTHLSRPSFLFGCFCFVLFLYVWISPSFNDVTKTWKTRRREEEAREETCIFWWLFFYIDLNVYLFFEGVFVTSMTNKDSFLYSLW